jgi:hypothetical protein
MGRRLAQLTNTPSNDLLHGKLQVLIWICSPVSSTLPIYRNETTQGFRFFTR